MLCPSCGKEVPEDAIYCPYCRNGSASSASQ
ncbi:zinc-ribbon domain-containing protein [Candidatus Bathyarchaeota archaeon]|nr:zinc-ribbon domain-containing protein [Candidatus Bathyarchaeota archaeon]